MAGKSETTPQKQTSTPENPMSALAEIQENGFGNMLGMGKAWMEAMSDVGAEWASFVAERIREDVKTQHEMLQCKNLADLQHIQAEFLQKAMDQYRAETGKLVEMSTKAFQPKPDGKTK